MSILPLPQFEEDLRQLQEEDRRLYESLAAPKTLVVRFGELKMVGEFPYDGTVKPGCGSKMVIKTHRGTELGEMLTSTCPNSGCGKSVSRQEMLRYIENSGGRDYPFFQDGRVLRVATPEDLRKQQEIEQSAHEMRLDARRVVEPLRLPLKVVSVEPILGGERLTIHYASEERVDLTQVYRVLQECFRQKLDLKHVGPRDEARITADYEKCGQYCCCKNFLKVLKPISMKSAKIQKATLDPLKISGRCGRLMCCLRYEDETYDELRKRLPNKKKRVGTPEGDGLVLDSQILTQLVLIRLDQPGSDGKIQEVAIPVENLTAPANAVAPAGCVNAPGWGQQFAPPAGAPGSRPPQGPRPAPPGGAPRRDDRSQSRRDEGQSRRDEGQPRPNQPRPPEQKSRPPAPQPPQRRPDAPPQGQPRPPRNDELDEIMEGLNEGDEVEGSEGDARRDQGAPRAGGGRRRRRRRRGRGGPGGGGPGGGGGPPGGPPSGGPA